jgi:hypothetical protein
VKRSETACVSVRRPTVLSNANFTVIIDNTLIDEGYNGRFFQITPKGEIVWEYISPYFGNFPDGGRDSQSNWVYRAQPVPYEWAPAGTAHSEKAVNPPSLAEFRIPATP